MAIRAEAEEFVGMGPLPPSDTAQVEDLEKREALLKKILPPVSAEEAEELVTCFGPDECFGLAWSLLHLIETSPLLPDVSAEVMESSQWLHLVWRK